MGLRSDVGLRRLTFDLPGGTSDIISGLSSSLWRQVDGRGKGALYAFSWIEEPNFAVEAARQIGGACWRTGSRLQI